MRRLSILLIQLLGAAVLTKANLDYFHSASSLDFPPPNYWPNNVDPNSILNLTYGCVHCGQIFYNEPPPDDIMYIPPPPLHPHLIESFPDSVVPGKQKQEPDQCIYCNSFYSGAGELVNADVQTGGLNNRIFTIMISILTLTVLVCLYLIGSRRTNIISSLNPTTMFKSSAPYPHGRGGRTAEKTNSLNDTMTNSSAHIADRCYLQTNRDKNLTSPIVSDQVPHKKTAIPSKCWSQPGSIIGRTIRRIPNEYEVPSSQTNSTGTSAAVYTDMNHHLDQNDRRFYSPYNLHTYAEVREVLDLDEHLQSSSNSSAMHSESNYDNNGMYNGNNCMPQGNLVPSAAPNGSVQMSDFNSLRLMQSMMAYGHQPTVSMTNHNSLMSAPKMHNPNNNGQPLYEQPPQRAQIIITSNNQGMNPTLINYKDRIHNVI